MAYSRLQLFVSRVDDGNYGHTFFLYMDASGKKFIARAGAGSVSGGVASNTDILLGNAVINAEVAEASASLDYDHSLSTSDAFRIDVAKGDLADTQWSVIKNYFQDVDSLGLQYNGSLQNSNSVIRGAFAQIGIDSPIFPIGVIVDDLPGFSNNLAQTIDSNILHDVVVLSSLFARQGPWSRASAEHGEYKEYFDRVAEINNDPALSESKKIRAINQIWMEGIAVPPPESFGLWSAIKGNFLAGLNAVHSGVSGLLAGC